MMCSACSVPVALGWKDRGANPETTLGIVMGLATIFLLFPGPATWGRIIASLLLVVIFTPLVVKLVSYFNRKRHRHGQVAASIVFQRSGTMMG